MTQTTAPALSGNEQPFEKKVLWISPDFIILSPDIIKGSGDTGPDFNSQIAS